MTDRQPLVHFEEDERNPFHAARNATVEQLRLAQGIIAEAAGIHQGAASAELLAGVVQAFATNFAGLVISREIARQKAATVA